MYGGYIKIYRSIMRHWIWNSTVESQRWESLLMLASWDDVEVEMGYSKVKVKRGQYITTTRFLMGLWRTNARSVLDFLKKLEKNNMIKVEKTPRMTVITIVNYEKFQGADPPGNDDDFPVVIPPPDEGNWKHNRKQNKKNNKKNNKILSDDDGAGEQLPSDKEDLLELMTSNEKMRDGCASLGVTQEQYIRLAEEVASDWKFTEEQDRTAKHFLNVMRKKANDLKSKKQKNAKRTTTTGSNSDRRSGQKNAAGTDSGAVRASLRDRAKPAIARGEDQAGTGETTAKDGGDTQNRIYNDKTDNNG